jgi:hypothetical protein
MNTINFKEKMLERNDRECEKRTVLKRSDVELMLNIESARNIVKANIVKVKS